jgi:hypothetical protein
MGMTGTLLRVTQEQLEAFLDDSSLFEDYIDSEEMEEHETKVDIYKYWDGLNYLLCNNDNLDPMLFKSIFSSQILDNEQDIGYGPAQYLTVDQVKKLSDAIDMTSDDQIRQGFDTTDMTLKEVYLSPWQDKDLTALMNYYHKLKDFYLAAAKQGQAVITYIE